MRLPTLAGGDAARDVDEAAARAVDAFVDRLRLGVDAQESYDALAGDVLRACAHLPVDRLHSTVAVLDDGTRLRFEPAMVRMPWSLQLRHMLGFTTRVGLLPPPVTRGDEPALRTRRGTRLWTWPVQRDGAVRAVLRGVRDGAPVLVTGAGVRLWSPEDAATYGDGLVLDAPTHQVRLTEDGVVVTDTAPVETRLARAA